MKNYNSLLKWVVAVSIVTAITFGFVVQNFDPSKISQNKDESPNGISINGVVSESVETIQSPYIKEYSLPDGMFPNGILVDKEGFVWIAGSMSNTLIVFDPKTSQIKSTHQLKNNTSDNLPSQMVWSIIQDNEGLIWFSQMGKDPLWQFNPKTERFTTFHSISAAPFQMKVDQKTGNIWFTTLTKNTVGVIQKQPQSYKITEFDIGSDAYPSGLFLEDNYIWITLIKNQSISKFSIITDKNGIVTGIKKILEIPQNNQTKIFSPTDMLRSNDLWITEHGMSFLTKYNMDKNNLERFPTAVNSQHSTTLPFWVRHSLGGDGIWFNEHTGNRIAFFDVKNEVLTEYEIPSRPVDGFVVYPLNIALDPTDNNKIWFSEWNINKFGVLDTNISAPFDIRVDSDIITIDSDQTAELVFDVTKTSGQLPENNTKISFSASSSMSPNSELVNMTAKFSPSTIDLSEINQSAKITLVLQNNGTKQANYTLGVSATNGVVTKSVFLGLEIR